MKKMIGSLLAIMLAASVVQAQKHETLDRKKDQVQFKGYTVQLLPALAGTYGYDIIKDNEVLLHQVHNPFNGSRIGLAKKDDAYKLAFWQIENIQKLPAPQGFSPNLKWPLSLKQNLSARHRTERVIIPRVDPKLAEQWHIHPANR